MSCARFEVNYFHEKDLYKILMLNYRKLIKSSRSQCAEDASERMKTFMRVCMENLWRRSHEVPTTRIRRARGSNQLLEKCRIVLIGMLQH